MNSPAFRVASCGLLAIYVAFVLNSKIGRLQTQQLSAGSAQQELDPKDIDNFYTPFINKETQIQIADLVQQSFTLKAESEWLLATAKSAVEIAIETDEQTAINYINKQTGELSCNSLSKSPNNLALS